MPGPYTLVVGNSNFSSWSLRPWLALKHTGAAFETVSVRLRQPDTKQNALKHSPSGKVPVLKSEGLLVWDSLAICETLAERHPEAKLWPADANKRAQARSLSAEMHSGFQGIRNALPMDFARKKSQHDPHAEAVRVTQSPPMEDVKIEIARIIDAWTTALTENPDGGFLFGGFSIADCMYAPVVSRFVTYDVALPNAAKSYAMRIMLLPAMQEWMAKAKAEIAAGIS